MGSIPPKILFIVLIISAEPLVSFLYCLVRGVCVFLSYETSFIFVMTTERFYHNKTLKNSDSPRVVLTKVFSFKKGTVLASSLVTSQLHRRIILGTSN